MSQAQILPADAGFYRAVQAAEIGSDHRLADAGDFDGMEPGQADSRKQAAAQVRTMLLVGAGAAFALLVVSLIAQLF